MSSNSAIVLLSGGLDSATVLALAHAASHRLFALNFAYGQRHAVEVACARVQAGRWGAALEVVDLAGFGRLVAEKTSLSASSKLSIPKARDLRSAEIPSTYVPARNTIFLAYALAWAEVIEAGSVWIGVNAIDYSGYPDCRPEFIRAFEAAANLGTKMGVEGAALRIEAPLQHLHKHEIIALGHRLGVDYSATISCYDPVVSGDRGYACGECDSCRLRRDGFAGAGVPDPTEYAPRAPAGD